MNEANHTLTDLHEGMNEGMNQTLTDLLEGLIQLPQPNITNSRLGEVNMVDVLVEFERLAQSSEA